MGRADPFAYYSVIVRTIVYVLVPAFGVLQFFRLRRALHVFQLEGYKRARFLAWLKANPGRRSFLQSAPQKKPLVMTGRAWRILVTATALSVLGVLVPSGLVHVAWGAPWDLITSAAAFAFLYIGLPRVLVGADILLTPVQGAINARYLLMARRKLNEIAPRVIGVTGSFGKTSTKFSIQSLVSLADEVLATPGSFNTPLGVCRTINEQLEPRHRFFVVEMGAYGVGEIAELCRFVRPTVGVLTAIGPAHLERFGSMDAIRKGKYEIIESLGRDGTAVMNTDDPEVRALADRTTDVRLLRYGLDPEGRPDVTARDVETGYEGTSFTIVTGSDELHVRTRLLGRHALGHILAAVAVATSLGRSLRDLIEPIAALQPVEHRLQVIEGAGGVTVIDDAYNSNPDGAAAALEVLAAMPARNRVVVTPGIIELGPLQAEANAEFGRQAATVADTVIFVARLNRDALVTGAGEVDDAEVIVVDSLEEATRRMQGLLGPGDVVLFENDLPDQYEH
ncbi:MAG TPA: UDP-N-acetylmuramoyl-tripeptide--D-alanyl-D-alanine ligase [Actinomycetota bacterium]|nr:UDP-N-acetylmuramoyl-tripeptide--D-alanyl-D-alanine ligase [Actinomycetota bacterium]